MIEIELKILGKFYYKLCDSIRGTIQKSTKNESPITIFLGTTVKKVYKTLQACSFPAFTFRKEESQFNNLVNKHFIREGEKSGEYIITPFGIWEYENNIKKFGLESFLNYVDKKYYSNLIRGQEKPLSAKEKIVIFGMIAIRSLSKVHCIDLNDDKNLTNYWTEIFNRTKEILLELDIITKIDYDSFWKERDNDVLGAVQYLMSHINELSTKTKSMYRNPGKRIYFLDIPKNLDFIKSNLKFLLKKVIDNVEITEAKRLVILEFLNNMSFEFSIYIFEEKDDFYFNSKFNELIEDLVYFL